MSEIPASSTPDDEHDPELIQGLIDLAAKIRRDPPRTPAAAMPILDLLRLAAPGGAGGAVTKLGKYTLQQSLGAGAYGAVWKARDDELGRTVAIKIPHSHVLLQPNLAECYAQEIELMARLDHSHIVPVHDVYREPGLVALVMAYCSGPSLAGWLAARGTPAPPQLAAEILRDLSQATQVCHQRAIVHGDIKPSNVLLFPNGGGGDFPFTPKLTDFGLACLANAPRTERDSSLWRGTLEYMAPEQIRGDDGARGVSSDIYSLGVVLYELLTGTPPFVGPGVGSTLARVLEEPPVPPRRQRPKIPRDLERICLKCLAKEPGDRYLTAMDLAAELQAFLEDRPVHARPNSWRARLRRYVRRPERVTEAGVLTVALHAALMVWMVVATTMAAAGVRWLPEHMTSLGMAADSAKMGLLDASIIGLAALMVRGQRWAAAVAGAGGLALALFSAGNLSGWIQPPFDGVYAADRKLQVVVFSLLTVLFALQALACGLAWLTLRESAAERHARSPQPRWPALVAVAGVLAVAVIGMAVWPRSVATDPAISISRTGAEIPTAEQERIERDYEHVIWGPVIHRDDPRSVEAISAAGRYAARQLALERTDWWNTLPGNAPRDPLLAVWPSGGVTQIGLIPLGADGSAWSTYLALERRDSGPSRRFTATLELAEHPEWYMTPTGHVGDPALQAGTLLRLHHSEPGWPIPLWSVSEQSGGTSLIELVELPGWFTSHTTSPTSVYRDSTVRLRVEQETPTWLAPTWRLRATDFEDFVLEHAQLHGWYVLLAERPNDKDPASTYLEFRPLRDGEQPTRWRVNRVK